jgi:hypothetical protein
VYVRDDAGQVDWAVWCHVPFYPGGLQRALARVGLSGTHMGPGSGSDDQSDGNDFGTLSSGAVTEPANTEQCQEVWGQNTYWDPDFQTCIIVHDGVEGGGSAPPPPPPPEEDYYWGPGPEPGDPNSGGGSGGGDGTPLEPPSPEDDSEALAPCPQSIAGNTHLYLRAPNRSTPIGRFTFRGPHENQAFDGTSSTGIWRPFGIDPLDLSDGTRWMARGVFVAVCERTILGVRIRPLPNEDPRDGSTEFYGEVWRVW